MRARGVLLLALWACTARANHAHAPRSRPRAHEILIQNIKEKLVTDNDDYVPQYNESEFNLVVNDAKSEINDPESTNTQSEPTPVPRMSTKYRKLSDSQIERSVVETEFEIAFGSDIARPKIKIAPKTRETPPPEPTIAQSEFELDQLEPNTAPPEPDDAQLNPVFAQLDPNFAQPEFKITPELDVDPLDPNVKRLELEPNTAPPEPEVAQPKRNIARPQFKFAPEPSIAQPEYAEFEFTTQSKHPKPKISQIELKEAAQPKTVEPEFENVSEGRHDQIEENTSFPNHKSAMLEMVEEISEKTELHRGDGIDGASKYPLRTNQVPDDAQSAYINRIPNKRFKIQSSRFVSSTYYGASNTPAIAKEESSAAGFRHATEPSAARPLVTATVVTPVVVPAIVVYNFYPIPSGISKPKKQVKNKKVRGTSRGIAKPKRQRQGGRKAPRSRPQAGRGGSAPVRPRPDRGGTTQGSPTSGVITFRYHAEIPLEVPLSKTFIANAFS